MYAALPRTVRQPRASIGRRSDIFLSLQKSLVLWFFGS
jgi:hypothetical protein